MMPVMEGNDASALLQANHSTMAFRHTLERLLSARCRLPAMRPATPPVAAERAPLQWESAAATNSGRAEQAYNGAQLANSL